MRSTITLRSLMLLLALAVFAGACAAEETAEETAAEETAGDATDPVAAATADATEPTEDMASGSATPTEDMATQSASPTEDMATEGTASADSTTICDADAIVEAVEGGGDEGTLSGMADDPVGTAASNNPVLTTLTAAATEAGLVDTLNSAEALTVFAPTDCAFAALDPATLDAAMADPSGLLTTVLGYHVIAGEQLSSDQLSGEYETFTGETLTVDGTTVGGQAEIVVPDVMTANATVHLIDTVMIPPSVSDAAAEPTEG